MAADVQALLDQEGIVPHGFVAHSAGAAVALQMCREADGPSVLGINAALGHFEGLAGFVFPAMAKMLAAMPFSAKLFSGASSRPERIAALIDSTGSKLTAEGHALYQRLVGDPDHVDGTLKMMAQWDLQPLLDDLSALSTHVLFLTGSKDSTVPPSVSQRAAEQMRGATHVSIQDRGHLLHEEVPELVAEHAFQFFGPK
jgi:magnesium chelatase accessory protein